MQKNEQEFFLKIDKRSRLGLYASLLSEKC